MCRPVLVYLVYKVCTTTTLMLGICWLLCNTDTEVSGLETYLNVFLGRTYKAIKPELDSIRLESPCMTTLD